MPDLHPGIEWPNVERSLRADPTTLARLAEDNKKGHFMNVFAEEGDEYIFVTAQLHVTKMDASHRNVMFDKQAQSQYPYLECRGNAVDIAITQMGAELADGKYNEQLRSLYEIDGWYWLKTSQEQRNRGYGLIGENKGLSHITAHSSREYGAFRVSRKVKKISL